MTVYTRTLGLVLGKSNDSVVDLRAQLVDTDGMNVGGEIDDGFVNINGGNYIFTYSQFPLAFRGAVKFYRDAEPALTLGHVPINPEQGGQVIEPPVIGSLAAMEVAEGYCRRRFARATGIEELHDGTGRDLLLLSRPPVLASSLVVELDGVELDESEISVYPDHGIVKRRNNVWPFGDQNIEVIYTGGFDPIPEDITIAVNIIMLHMQSSMKTVGGFKKRRLGDYFYEITEDKHAQEIPYHARWLLDRYVLEYR